MTTQLHLSYDWCHVCGRRSHHHIIFGIPKNAEHSTDDEDRGRVRICLDCLIEMQNQIARGVAEHEVTHKGLYAVMAIGRLPIGDCVVEYPIVVGTLEGCVTFLEDGFDTLRVAISDLTDEGHVGPLTDYVMAIQPCPDLAEYDYKPHKIGIGRHYPL